MSTELVIYEIPHHALRVAMQPTNLIILGANDFVYTSLPRYRSGVSPKRTSATVPVIVFRALEESSQRIWASPVASC